MLRRWKEAQEAEKLFWNSVGVICEETAEILKRYSEIFLKIKADKNWKILDVGCGPTVVSRMIEGGEKYGMDPLMNSFVGKVHDKDMLKSFHFLRGVGEWLPFRNDCLDLVVCRNVLDHVQFPEEVLKEIKRVSKSSAILVLGVNAHSEFVFRLKKGVERMGIVGLREKWHPYFFTEQTFQKLCSKYFSIVGKKIVFSNETRWKEFGFKMPPGQDQRTKNPVFILYSTLSFFSSWIFVFFWNIVRLLNHKKAPYFAKESVIIARPNSPSLKS